jgi:hypothetical protein
MRVDAVVLTLALTVGPAVTPMIARAIDPAPSAPATASAPNDSTSDASTESRRDGLSVSAFPVLYSTPETGLAGGAGMILTHREVGASETDRPRVLAFGGILTEKKQAAAIISPEIYLGHQTWRIEATADYQKFPTSIFGIGNDTAESAEETYTLEGGALQASVLRRIRGIIRAGLAVDLKHRSIQGPSAGGLLDRGLLPGHDGGFYIGSGPRIDLDNRDNTFFPTRGSWGRVGFTSYGTSIGSDAAFSTYGVDLRHYGPIGAHNVLAIQALASGRSGRVPFHDLPQLGEVMRGLVRGRLTDRSMAFLQVEDRFPIVWRFGGAAFASVGDVARGLDRLRFRRLKCGGGFGLRFLLNSKDKLHMRADLGVTRYGSEAYFQIMEAF